MMCSFSLTVNPSGLRLQNRACLSSSSSSCSAILLSFTLSDSQSSSHGLATSHIASSNTWSVVSRVWASVRVVRRYSSRHVFFQKGCIDCSPSSVRKVHPFDSLGVYDRKCMTCYDISDQNTTPKDEHLKNSHKLEKCMEHVKKTTLTTHQV